MQKQQNGLCSFSLCALFIALRALRGNHCVTVYGVTSFFICLEPFNCMFAKNKRPGTRLYFCVTNVYFWGLLSFWSLATDFQ